MSHRARWALILLLALVAAVIALRRDPPQPEAVSTATNALEMLMKFEEQQAQLHWAPELRAQRLGSIIDQFWNRLNRSTNKWATLGELQFELLLPQFENAFQQSLPHGVRVFNPIGGTWSELLATHSAAGWKLERCEFRHIAFFTNQLGRGVASSYYISGHLVNARSVERAVVEGNAMIWWNERPDLPPIRQVDARLMKVRIRRGAVPFRRVLLEDVTPPDGSYFIDPVIAWDTDGDDKSEIILAARNQIYRRTTNGTWTRTSFLTDHPGLILSAIVGDFTGDGRADYLYANLDGLFISEGMKEPPRAAWSVAPRLRYPQVLTSGDIDGDGDLDLFLGQYKVPYSEGQMPFPYFDAKDGHPSFLLLNDGRGWFTDGTARAGLAAKRARRVYSASLADIEADADLDLVVVSDFAGLDAYLNDGTGRFTDITRRNFGETYAFGMAHAFTDFNVDGLVDLFIVGMNSPTADRLTALRLERPYDTPDAYMRARVTYGNRLFFGDEKGKFAQGPVSDHVARTGWSWGVVAADFDNNGFPDLYIANGHETRELVQEYEPEFWLHDIYVGNSRENPLAEAYFKAKYARTRARGLSYGGHERNRFFLNLNGSHVVEVAHLFGLALEQDCRNVIADDFNGDGRLDLVVTTFEAWPEPRQTIQIYENHLPETGNWFGLTVPTTPAFTGARVTARQGGTWVLANGDSYRAQHAPKLHVGLGQRTNDVTLEILPIKSSRIDLRNQPINQITRLKAH